MGRFGFDVPLASCSHRSDCTTSASRRRFVSSVLKSGSGVLASEQASSYIEDRGRIDE